MLRGLGSCRSVRHKKTQTEDRKTIRVSNAISHFNRYKLQHHSRTHIKWYSTDSTQREKGFREKGGDTDSASPCQIIKMMMAPLLLLLLLLGHEILWFMSESWPTWGRRQRVTGGRRSKLVEGVCFVLGAFFPLTALDKNCCTFCRKYWKYRRFRSVCWPGHLINEFYAFASHVGYWNKVGLSYERCDEDVRTRGWRDTTSSSLNLSASSKLIWWLWSGQQQQLHSKSYQLRCL